MSFDDDDDFEEVDRVLDRQPLSPPPLTSGPRDRTPTGTSLKRQQDQSPSSAAKRTAITALQALPADLLESLVKQLSKNQQLENQPEAADDAPVDQDLEL